MNIIAGLSNTKASWIDYNGDQLTKAKDTSSGNCAL